MKEPTKKEVLTLISEISSKIKSKFIVEIRFPVPDQLINSWSTTIQIEPSDKTVALKLFKRQMIIEKKNEVLKELESVETNKLEQHWLFENIDRRSI